MGWSSIKQILDKEELGKQRLKRQHADEDTDYEYLPELEGDDSDHDMPSSSKDKAKKCFKSTTYCDGIDVVPAAKVMKVDKSTEHLDDQVQDDPVHTPTGKDIENYQTCLKHLFASNTNSAKELQMQTELSSKAGAQ